MKRLLLLLFPFIIHLSFAQTAPVIQWQNTIIGGIEGSVLMSSEQTSDGGYILGGYSKGGIGYDKTEPNLGEVDYWIIKVDDAGDIEWQNDIGGSGDDFLYSIHQASDGGYILGGFSKSGISGDKTEPVMGAFADPDYWIIKLDPVGAIQWQNTIGGLASDEFTRIQTTPDGGCIVGGTSVSGISGDKTEACLGATDYWVLKLNAAGSIEWQNTIGGSGADGLNWIEPTLDGGYIIAGDSYSDLSGDKTEHSIDSIYPYSKDCWIVKLSGSWEH
jgi:opacity protein-like surface antigen